jgi:hypothetical protein
VVSKSLTVRGLSFHLRKQECGLYEDIARLHEAAGATARGSPSEREVYGFLPGPTREGTVSSRIIKGFTLPAVPSSTDVRIEELCSRIRALCCGPFSPKAEAELRKLARDLRFAVNQHVEMAKSSLIARKAALIRPDPDLE